MRLFALIILMTSFSAMACPNLAGSYKCRSTTGDETLLNITQALTNGITTYTLTTTDEAGDESTEVVKANGKTTSSIETDPDSGMRVSTYITGSCPSEAFAMKVAIYMGNELLVNVTTRFSKSGNQLHQQLSGSAMGETVSDKIICE